MAVYKYVQSEVINVIKNVTFSTLLAPRALSLANCRHYGRHGVDYRRGVVVM